ncbi:HyaD/HybD family hydrogenase maturation endopeptidase [Thiohalorhabdus methylotrophus]|uniref:HyaD/HybD family hydrogenase maturation endopeptidase n=1 Tax=Thiohalorhabdus methylotrophus TaxID=3242694 RepID=A0ABV4TXB1_9GAMM
MGQAGHILVLGIGNLLWADEGFGVRAVEYLQRSYRFPEEVTVLDGGTQGLNLVGPVREADVLVVLDAVDFGSAPGTLHRVRDEEVPQFLGAKKMSLHQTGFQEVLATAELLGDPPGSMLLVGVQPEVLEDYGGSLTDTVAAQLEPAVVEAVEYLRAFGVEPLPRSAEPEEEAGKPAAALARSAYEEGRPGPEEACRFGDARFLPLTGGPNGAAE